MYMYDCCLHFEFCFKNEEYIFDYVDYETAGLREQVFNLATSGLRETAFDDAYYYLFSD